ncbi:CLOCK-interacting pacemaker isoform X2 [Tiliqua scincoides]|uniref:CLOCK-interacting pacemaker isoform X2 n=1 Tax=Tiliqua scincoides TaxID=71010 RepID=UPI00346198ED
MRVAAMPLEETALPGHPFKPGEEKTHPGRALKAEGPGCKGQTAQPTKVAGGNSAGRKSPRPASEGEKDSGFSDVSSEYLSNVEQTDTEEQSACPLRQPAFLQQSQFLTWSSQHQLDGAQGPPAHVLFIQQPVTALKPLLPDQKSPAKEPSLPISSYPKIAPRPGRDLQAKGAGEAGPLPTGGASKNKRFCLEEAWVSSSEPAAPGGGKEKLQEDPPPAEAALVNLEVLSQQAVTSSTDPMLPGLEQAEGRMISRASRKLGCSSQGKQRRFHNTVEILRKSGLLGIALRTKELIRQNSSIQRDLAELREHTQLLCEAVQSNDSQAWSRLQEAMARSAAHWADKGASASVPPRQSLATEPTGPPTEVPREAPPSSPLHLSLAPDSLECVAQP